MSEWVVQVASMIPQGELTEFLMIARVDRVSGKIEIMRAVMEEAAYGASFAVPTDAGQIAS